MADLNSTIVRGNLRVTDDINTNGTINGNGSGLTNLNASNIGSGTLSVDRLATSGATAGSYGPNANAEPGYGSTFNVPYITVDNKGRVTAASTKTVKIPASDNSHNSHIVYSGKKSDGTTDISSGTASSGNITLGDSGATAGSYGNSSNQEPGYGSTFNVPYITVNAKGIVTGISNKTVKIPASDNSHNAHIVYSGKKSDGTTDISSGTASSGNITLGDSGASAGSYGNSSNQEPGYGSTFNVPYITVNAKGIITGISNKTVKIPASDNTNTASAVDNILDGSNSGTAITYAPYTTQQNKLSFDTSSTAPDRTDRLNLNGSLYATTFNVKGQATIQYNSTLDSIDIIFA